MVFFSLHHQRNTTSCLFIFQSLIILTTFLNEATIQEPVSPALQNQLYTHARGAVANMSGASTICQPPILFCICGTEMFPCEYGYLLVDSVLISHAHVACSHAQLLRLIKGHISHLARLSDAVDSDTIERKLHLKTSHKPSVSTVYKHTQE